MKGQATPCCAICLEPRTKAEGWFLLTENRWTDRLQVLAWNDALVSKSGVQAACGPAHVEQLVIHWMATGSLNYPFARPQSAPGRPTGTCCSKSVTYQLEPDMRGSKVLGELAVHRESLERILRENPESLGSILSALISALATHQQTNEVSEEEAGEDSVYELTEV